MTPPISIDGTDITGATIDGQDVQEITVDGQTVFTAETVIVAQSNLVAWWRFGDGNNAFLDDSANTADFADSTSYNLTEEGQSTQETNFLPSGGVTDVEDGANSSAYDMIPDGNLESSLTDLVSPFTVMGWVNFDSFQTRNALFGDWNSSDSDFFIEYNDDTSRFILRDDFGTQTNADLGATIGEWYHVAGVFSTTNRIFVNGVEEGTSSGATAQTYDDGDGFDIGSLNNSTLFSDMKFDDVRVYNRELTGSEISDIYQTTEP